MTTPNATTLPGADLSYTDLCDTGQVSRERMVWRGLCHLAEAHAIPTWAPGYGMATKTTQALIEDLGDILDVPDPLGMVLACADISPRSWDEKWLVKHLRQVGETWQFVPFTSCETEAEAEAERDRWVEENGETYIVVKIFTETKHEFRPPTSDGSATPNRRG